MNSKKKVAYTARECTTVIDGKIEKRNIIYRGIEFRYVRNDKSLLMENYS